MDVSFLWRPKAWTWSGPVIKWTWSGPVIKWTWSGPVIKWTWSGPVIKWTWSGQTCCHESTAGSNSMSCSISQQLYAVLHVVHHPLPLYRPFPRA